MYYHQYPGHQQNGFPSAQIMAAQLQHEQQPGTFGYPLASSADNFASVAPASPPPMQLFYGQAIAATAPPTAVDTSNLMDYPYNFFDLKVGGLPKNGQAALKDFWKYRKSRPRAGVLDDVIPKQGDGEVMLTEMKDIRADLRRHIQTSFYSAARQQAEMVGLRVQETHKYPVTPADFVRALEALKRGNNLQDETKAYMVCHHFHHGRKWLSDAIDVWLLKNNMRIVFPPNTDLPVLPDGKKRRETPNNRGGFSVVARLAKNEITKLLMRHMLSKAEWSVATRIDKKEGREKIYTSVSSRIGVNPKDVVNFYIVTRNQGTDGRSNTALSTQGTTSATNSNDLIAYGNWLASR